LKKGVIPNNNNACPYIFDNGTKVRDAYSGETSTVVKGKVNLNTDFGIILLEKL
jgi:alpha-amylase